MASRKGPEDTGPSSSPLVRVEKSHPYCPECGLPTFKDDEGRFFCASCDETYESGKGKLTPHIIRENKPGWLIPLIISVIVILMLIIAAAGVYLYTVAKEEKTIDIHDVAEIRELEAKKDVPVSYMKPTFYDDYIESRLDDEARQDLWELERFYECMLVIDPDWDLISMAENSSSSNILAFYETDTEEITIIDGDHSDVYLNYILSHELTHALQDQNFDLESYYPTGNYDSDIARLSAIEGDAMLTMEMWAEENLDPYDYLKLSTDLLEHMLDSELDYNIGEYNRVITEMEYFPYIDGMEFVSRIHTRDGYGGVDLLFTTRPPLSTEQVIHFEKYLQMEPPETIDMDLEGLGMDVVFETTAGEKLLTEILPDLSDEIEELDGSRSGIGWGGDRFVYMENGSDFMSVFAIQWDTEEINDIFHFHFEDLMFWEGDGFRGNHTVIDGDHMYIFKDGRRTYIIRSDSLELIEQTMGYF